MRGILRRLPLEGAVRLAIVLTVLAVACGSNWSPALRSVAGPLRWLCLAALCALSLLLAAARAAAGRRTTTVHICAALLLGAALVSSLWSADPRLSAGRVVAFGTVLAIAAALSSAAAGRPELVARLLLAVLGGAILVALAGLAILAVDPGKAIQEATQHSPARFRGLGQNPNTAVMLFAVGMPIATWAFSRRGAKRAPAAAAFLLLAGSIVASGSRAAMLAGFAAALAPALAAARTRRRILVAAGTLLSLLGLGLALGRIPKPNPDYHKTPVTSPVRCTARDAQCYLRLEDEIGRPAGGAYRPSGRRRLLGSSGRIDAWQGGLHQAADRLLAGYGFGTEGRTFVDRYYSFEGGVPENSFVGMLLQLGVAGLVLLLGLLATLAAAAVRALRGADPELAPLAAACAAVLAVGVILACFQSYLYAAGNTATLSVWLCAFLATALAARRAAVA